MSESSINASILADIEKIKSEVVDIKGSLTITTNIDKVLKGIDSIKSELKDLDGIGKIDIISNDSLNSLKEAREVLKDIQNANKIKKRIGGNRQIGKGKRQGKESENSFIAGKKAWTDKYVATAEKEIDKYIQTLSSRGATPLSSRVRAKYDKEGNETGYEGVVAFRNELGKTTQAILSYNKARDEWRVKETAINSNYEAQSKAEEKIAKDRADNLSKWQIALDKINSEAFNRENKLSGDFATPVRDAIAAIQKEIDSFNNTNKKMTDDVARSMKERFASLGNLYKEQYDKQYPDTKQKSVDTKESVERYTAQLNKAENDLSRMGMLSDDLKNRIEEVRNGFNSVGKEDGDALGKWVDKFGTLQQKINEFKSSVEGRSMKLGFEIESGQLNQIDALTEKLNNLPSNLSGSGVAAAKEELAALSQEYQNVVSQLASPDITQDQFNQLTQKLKELDDRLKQVSNSAKIFNDGFKNSQDIQKYNDKVDGIKNNFDKLERTYEHLIETNPDIAARFNEVRSDIENIDPMNITAVSTEVTNLGRACSNAAGETSGLRGALTDAFGGVGQYLARFTSAFYIISKGIQTVKSMVNEVKSLDTSLMELQKVTTLSGNSLTQFTESAYKTGKEVGRTGKDVIDAVTTFSRAGYTLEESTQLAKSALVMTNVGVDIQSTGAAASDMISILKAFDKQADESMQVIDELYNVANKEPLDFGNITQMLVTAGGTLAQTGTSLEETMGLVTGAFATLRDESVANGLIMISQRLRGVKEDGEAIEEAGFMPKLKKAFGDVGVAIEDENGELRSTYDILNDLAGKWDQLSSKQRQFLGEKAAGNRQVKTLNAIMANWDVVQDTIQKATEATGEATSGNEKYLDSIEGRLTQFRTAFQELSKETIGSDFVKGIVTVGTNVLKLVTNLGGLVPVLSTIAGIIAIIKAQKIQQGITTLIDSIKALVTGLSGAGGLAGALSTIPGAIGGILALVGIVSAVVTAIKNSKVSLAEKADASRQNYQDQQTKVEGLNTELENTNKIIDELEAKGSLTLFEQDQLDKAKETREELEKTLAIEKELLGIAQMESNRDAANRIEEYVNGKPQGKTDFSSEVEKRLEEIGNISKDAQYEVGGRDYIRMGVSGTTQLKYIQELMEYIPKIQQAAKDALNEGTQLGLAKYNFFNELLKDYKIQISDFYTNLNEMLGDYTFTENAEVGSIEEKLNSYLKIKESIGDWLFSSSSVSKAEQFNRIISEYPKQLEKISKAAKKSASGFGIDQIFGSIEDKKARTTIGDILEEQYGFADAEKTIRNAVSRDRKVIDAKAMQEAGWEIEDGEIATYLSSSDTFKVGEEEIPYVVTFTPITPDGKVYTEEELASELSDLFDPNKSKTIEDVFARDENKILLHFTPVVNGKEAEAIFEENTYGALLHALDGARSEGEITIGEYLNELLLDATENPERAEEIYNEVYSVIKAVADKLESQGSPELKQAMENMFGADMLEEFSEFGWTYGDVIRGFVENVLDATQQTSGFATSLEMIMSESFAATESYKNLTTAMTEQQKAGVITMETYEKLISDEGLQGIQKYLVLTAEGFALNTDALYNYIKAQNDESKTNALSLILEKQEALANLQEQLQNTIDAQEQANMATQAEQLQEDISALQAYVNSLDAATGALARYRAAKKTPNGDEDYNEGQGALKQVKEGWKSGKVGTDDYQDAMGFFLGSDWQGSDKYQGAAGRKKAQQDATKVGNRYFADEKKGVNNFVKDLKKLAKEREDLLSFDKDGNLTIADDTSLDEIASGLSKVTGNAEMSEDAIASLFKLLETYSPDKFTWPNVPNPSDPNDPSNPDKQKQLEEYDRQLEQANRGLENAMEVGDTQGIEDAQNAIETLTREKDALQNGEDIELTAQTSPLDELQTRLSNIQKTVEYLNSIGVIDVVANMGGTADTLSEAIMTRMVALGLLPDTNLTINAEDNASEMINTAVTAINGVPQSTETTMEGNSDSVVGATGKAIEAVNTFDENANPDTVEFKGEETVTEAKDSAKTAVDEFNAIPSPYAIPLTAENKTSDGINDATTSVTDYANGIYNATIGVTVDPVSYTAAETKLAALTKKEPKEVTVEIVDPNGDPVGDTTETVDWYDNTHIGDNGETRGYEGTLPYPERSSDLSFDPHQRLNEINTALNAYSSMVDGVNEENSEQLHQIVSELEKEKAELEALLHGGGDTNPPGDNNPPSDTSGGDNGPKPKQNPKEKANFENEKKKELEATNRQIQDLYKQWDNTNPFTDGDTWDAIGGEIEELEARKAELEELLGIEEDIEIGITLNDGAGEQFVSDVQGEVDGQDPIKVLVEPEFKDNWPPTEDTPPQTPTPPSGATPPTPKATSSPTVTPQVNMGEVNSDLASLGQTVTKPVDADTSKAQSKIKALDDAAKKGVTKTVTVKTVGDPSGAGGGSNGKFASGTKNAPLGISLVDEKGAELIEHVSRGTFELGTDDGARFTQLDKGDVVHTAKETKSILKRMAKIGGFFRDGLNKGKSVIGDAFARGIGGTISLESINRVLGSTRKKVKGSGSSNSSSAKAEKSNKKFKKWAEKLFDWAEIRLDRLKTVTNSWLLSAAEAIGYMAKNKELSGAIESVGDEIDATTQAYDLYIKQADIVQKKAKLSDDIVKKIQQGNIEIASYSKATQEKIKEYQLWYEKAMACSEALNDLREQEKELAKQKLDNIITHFDNRSKRLENIVRKRESDLALATAEGRELFESEYTESIDATTKKLENLIKERDALQTEFNELVTQGYIEKESDDWFEYSSKLDDVNNAIVETKTAIIDLHDAVYDINLTKLGYQLDELVNKANRMSDLMSLHAAQVTHEQASAYEDLINNGMDQIKNLEEQNESYRQQQEGLDVLSEKYQDLESKIQSNISTINKMKVSQEEWNDSVLDLKIAQLEEYKNMLEKTNEQYERQKELQEAIEELQRIQNQRTQKIYKEGVGFVYQEDQDALKDAQENLENVIKNQLLDRIDDLIDAINAAKNDTNVYDAEGNLLGTSYTLPHLGTLTDILSTYYASNSVPQFSGLSGSLYDQIISGATNNSSTQFNFGDINLSDVNDVETLGNAIVDLLPNAILQAINRRS